MDTKTRWTFAQPEPVSAVLLISLSLEEGLVRQLAAVTTAGTVSFVSISQ